MIGMLAQTLQHSGEVDWRYWLNLAVAVFATIALPIILFILKSVMDRLRKGDEMFTKLSDVTIELKTQRSTSQTTLDEIKSDLKDLTKSTHDIQLEDQGILGKFRADIERDFVRKAELKELRDHADTQHAEVMREIRSIRENRKN